MQPHPVSGDELVLTIAGVHQAGGGREPGPDMEQSPPDPAESDQVTQEEGGDGDEEADQDAHQPQPLHGREFLILAFCVFDLLNNMFVKWERSRKRPKDLN